MSKILIIAGNARSLIANRQDLILAIKNCGWEVEALVPSSDYLPEVEELGIPIHQITLGRTGINPFDDLKSVWQMRAIIKKTRPIAVFSYTVKPVIFGTVAARLAGVKRCYAMVTGLGHLYTTRTIKTRILKLIVSGLYNLAFRLNERIFFQNPDDIKDFEALGVIKNHKKVTRTYGSGIALDRFPIAPLPEGPITFLFIGRLLTEKGVAEFCEAAQLVKNKSPHTRFIAVGPYVASLPHSIRQRDYGAYQSSGVVEFVGGVSDVKPYIAACHVFVLPSYREGTPRSVLEAMSMRRAIITSDAPGCRETVEHNVNGFLTPVKDAQQLAANMQRFVDEPQLLIDMALQSRKMVEALYDVKKVNETMLKGMRII
ncbi:MAG: glycosyltransferase family 4 protein [Idiomarina sp.]|nr:glycosyltransferase family 4 protein [Idiomarina sp.]